MKRITPKYIERLNPDEVIVIGTNSTGFHGAGMAGLALRGDSRNNWREDKWFIDAMNKNNDGIGHWAIFGISKGFMQGKTGKSYGIETIIRPGLKRSMPLIDIKNQVDELISFAKNNPDLKILVTEIGTNLAGYSVDEIAILFTEALPVKNIHLPESFWKFLIKTMKKSL